MKFLLEEIRIPLWCRLAGEALVWSVRGHLGQKFSSYLAWNHTDHKAQSGLFPSPHIQGIFQCRNGFLTQFLFELSEILISFAVWKTT